jgi:arabinan endo-1,5-alpha-L-arabinosidase
MDSIRRLACALMAIGLAFTTGEIEAQGLTGNINLHDPSTVIEQDGTFYLFYTRSRVGIKRSTDHVNWLDNNARIFANDEVPDWHDELVPANTGNLWAPDVAYFNNLYHVYYSVSSFGSQTSAIGLATSPTLNPNDADYGWTDRGPVIESSPGEAPWNAIDPAILQTSSGDLFITWGSFWDGLYGARLNPDTGLLAGRGGTPQHLADRSSGSAIEAPYIYERDGSFYLFVNWDSCCRPEVFHTYNIRVGRSDNPLGPFVDRNGMRMDNGGGTLFLGTEDTFIGPGHASIFTDEGVDWFGYHYYDGADNGRSKYNLRTVYWDNEGWPVIGDSVPVAGDYNNDGTVNAADYVVWRNLQGTESLLPNRNPGLDGEIGMADYEYWQASFGNSFGQSRGGTRGSGTQQVPEPNTLTLLAGIIVAGLAAGRPRRSTRR